MKRSLVFTTILLFVVYSASAQINQGQWMVGGNINFGSEKQGNFKATHFNFSPGAGYFFINNLAGGLLINISSDKPDGGAANNYTLVAPFMRYYFLPTPLKVNIFTDVNVGFGSGKINGTSAGINQFSISAGPAIFLNPHTAFEVSLFYKSQGGKYYEGGTGDRWNTFGLNIGFQIHL